MRPHFFQTQIMNITLKHLILNGLFLFLLLFSAAYSISAQTSLAAGAIAFTGYISDSVPDEFSFVLLTPIAAGTSINFTNNSWLDTNVFRTGETTVTWTSDTAIPRGTEFKIAGMTATLVNGNPNGTVTGTELNLSTGGDQIIAYQGTVGTPVFISAIHMNVYSTAAGDPVDTTAAVWDGTNSDNTNASSVPTGLTTGTTAIWVGVFQNSASEFDNARYTCGSGGVGTPAVTRATVNNQANWTQRSNTPDPVGFTLPTGCPYLNPTAAQVSLGGRVTNASGQGVSKAYVSVADVNGFVRTALTNQLGYYNFTELTAGESYILNISNKQYQFSQSSEFVSLDDTRTDVDFVALP
jgi:hypothetical protein